MMLATNFPGKLLDNDIILENWLRNHLPNSRINFSILLQKWNPNERIQFKIIPEFSVPSGLRTTTTQVTPRRRNYYIGRKQHTFLD